MKRLRDERPAALEWVQKGFWKRIYELRSPKFVDSPAEVFAILRFPSLFRERAEVEFAEGRWTLERSGILKWKVAVREMGSDSVQATFQVQRRGEGTVRFHDTRRFFWKRSGFWSPRWFLRTEAGEDLASVKLVLGFLRDRVRIDMMGSAVSRPELPILLALGSYIVILDARRSAAGAVH